MKALKYFSIVLFLLLGCEKDRYDSQDCIIGEWRFISRCGGATGECSYADKKYPERAVFTSDNKYYRYINEYKTEDYNYQFGKTFDENGITSYEIYFVPSTGTSTHNWPTRFWFSDNKYLNLVGGDFVDKFVRIK